LDDDFIMTLFGFVGEVGSFSVEYKKCQCDIVGYRVFCDEVCEDFGDLIWYAAVLVCCCYFDFDEVFVENFYKME